MAALTTEKGIGPLGFLGLSPLSLGLISASACYVILCSFLRFRRINQTRTRYNFPDRASLSRMTNMEAHEILADIYSFEFPLLYDFGLRFALFKTYAIDNIGNLLYAISDLAKPDQAPKRYEDTQVLFSCFAKFRPGSRTLTQAVARTNYLHNPYIKCSKIRNEDLLYVLYESIAEPVRFVRLYEWRELTDMEVAAISTFWKYIGDMMEIDYKAELGKDEWTDGVEFLEDLTMWADQYEIKHMGPSPGIAKVGEVLVDLLLSAYPKFAWPLGYKMIMVLMSERMRHAFSFPEPGVPESALTFTVLLIRKLCIRYLCLPRIIPVVYVGDPDPISGRIKQHHHLKEPWYTPITFWSRWGPEALLQRAFGLMVPGDGGAEMKPDGFLFEDIGPRSKMGKGVEETSRLAEVAHTKVRSSACPFARAAKA